MLDWLNNAFELMMGDLVVYTNGNDFTTCNGEWLVGELASCSIPPTHEELSALPMAEQGWQKVFDQWKSQGLIN
jgi:hypothetical protein